MNETNENIQIAIELIDQQLARVGNELEPEKRNLRELVANRDRVTQEKITELSESLAKLAEGLVEIRNRLVLASVGKSGDAILAKEVEGPGQDDEDSLSTLEPREAAKIRHDEPITLSGIFRSLLMANEPAQREKAASTD